MSIKRSREEQVKLTIFPHPGKIIVKNEILDISFKKWIYFPDTFSMRLKKHICDFAGEISSSLALSVKVTAGRPASGLILLDIKLVRKISEQGYELTIHNDGILLEASEESGVFYGLQTLVQIITEHGVRLPCCIISDYPDYKKRGVMLDISRCKVPTMDSLMKYIDLLAKLKINQFQLYMEHTFAFSAHETVWCDSSPITAEEIIRLDAYCAERFVELVPNLNSFGHYFNWLKHPEYKHLAECPDGDGIARWDGSIDKCGRVLRPDNRTLKFLDGLYAEFLPNFTSRHFNVGCDETAQLGRGWSKKLCEKNGRNRVYFDFLLRIQKLVKKYNRKMMFWGDIILQEPALIKELPRDIIALIWGYEAEHKFYKECSQFASSGVPFYVCPGTSSWLSLTGRTTNCIGNLANAAENGIKCGAEGFLNTDWGDGSLHYLPLSYLGILAGACFSWSYKSNRNTDFVDGLNRIFFKDCTGIIGKIFYDLGKVLERVKARPGNWSVFGKLLYCKPHNKEETFKYVEVPALLKCLEDFNCLVKQIPLAKPAVYDAELIKAELRNNIRMASHAVRKTLAIMRGKNEFLSLKKELEEIKSIHEELWLARNRIGGLRKSSDSLTDTLSAFDLLCKGKK